MALVGRTTIPDRRLRREISATAVPTPRYSSPGPARGPEREARRCSAGPGRPPRPRAAPRTGSRGGGWSRCSVAVRRARAQGLAQRGDVDAQVRFLDEGVRPHALQQLFLGDHVARALDQRHQQVEGPRGDLDQRVAAPQDAALAVEAEGAEAERLRRAQSASALKRSRTATASGSGGQERMPSASSTYSGVRAPFSTALTPGVLATTHSALRDRVSPRRASGQQRVELLLDLASPGAGTWPRPGAGARPGPPAARAGSARARPARIRPAARSAPGRAPGGPAAGGAGSAATRGHPSARCPADARTRPSRSALQRKNSVGGHAALRGFEVGGDLAAVLVLEAGEDGELGVEVDRVRRLLHVGEPQHPFAHHGVQRPVDEHGHARRRRARGRCASGRARCCARGPRPPRTGSSGAAARGSGGRRPPASRASSSMRVSEVNSGSDAGRMQVLEETP